MEESQSVQALLCHGISKLMLCECLTDERVSGSFEITYIEDCFPYPSLGFDQSSYGVRVTSHI